MGNWASRNNLESPPYCKCCLNYEQKTLATHKVMISFYHYDHNTKLFQYHFCDDCKDAKGNSWHCNCELDCVYHRKLFGCEIGKCYDDNGLDGDDVGSGPDNDD